MNAYNTSTAIQSSNPYKASESSSSKRTVTTKKVGYVYWHWMYNVSYANTTERRISATKDSSGSLAYIYFYAFAHTTDAPYLDTYYQNNDTGLKCYNCHNILSSSAKKNAADGGAGNLRHFRFEYYSSTYTDYAAVYRWTKTTTTTTSETSTTEVTAGTSNGVTISNVQKWVKYRAK